MKSTLTLSPACAAAMTRVSPIIAALLVLYAVKASRQSNLSPQACRQVRESASKHSGRLPVETNGPVMVAELSHVAVCIQPWNHGASPAGTIGLDAQLLCVVPVPYSVPQY